MNICINICRCQHLARSFVQMAVLYQACQCNVVSGTGVDASVLLAESYRIWCFLLLQPFLMSPHSM